MKRLTLSLLVVLSLVSCQPRPVADDTTTTLRQTTTSATAATTTATPGSTTSTTPALPDEESAIYLFFAGYPVAPGPYLVAVSRIGIAGLEETLESLLEGATSDERDAGLSSTIPAGTVLLGVEVSDGVAYVDLSREFESGGGSLSMMGRVAQIVYTATRFEGVDSVRLLTEGQPLDVLGGEGLIIDEPQTRSSWAELIPPIFVEEPHWGSTVVGQAEVAGTAQLESGTVSFAIVDADGTIIAEGEIASTPGARSDFSSVVVLDEIPHPGLGSIIVWEWAPDGSQRHVLEYPLTLVDEP